MGRNTDTFTFLPKTGAMYSGGYAPNGAEDIINLGDYMASFERKIVNPQYEGAFSKEAKEYVAANMSDNGKVVYKLTDVNSTLYKAQMAKKKIEHYSKMAQGSGRYDASVITKIQHAQDEYRAAINSDNENQLTIVQFVNEIIGRLEQPSYIASAFKNIPLDKLRGKIPEMGWPPVNVQVQRLSEPKLDYTEFGQSEFRIFRNDVHIYTNREDRMEAAIDPHATSIQQGNLQAMRARELLALKACSTLVNQSYDSPPDFTLTPSSSSAPRSTNDAPSAFVKIFTQHFNTYFNYLKYFIWNPLDYRAYLSNWYSYAFSQIQVPKGFGVVPFYGMQEYGCIAIISPYVPRTYVYALANEGAYELDGPYMVDAEYDAKKFADYNVLHDFIGYQISNPARFGEKIELTISGVSAGTEITTNKQIAALLQPPKSLVVKNTNPI